MKPIAIFRHAPSEGPGYFAEFLDEKGIPWQLIRIDAHSPLPLDVEEYSGLVFMGGPMSVNDKLPWIPPVLALIREAVGQDIPVLGHCLGGQLMARALGAVEVRNSCKEIGWGKVTVAENDTARAWFGSVGSFDAFHWHGETFGLPLGAAKFLSSDYCFNQGFALGKHLALQCHIEMTAEMITDWCKIGADEIAASAASPGVQSAAAMQAQTAEKLPMLHEVARRLYERWLLGLSA